MSINLIMSTLRPFGDTQPYSKWYHLFVWSISALSTLLVGLSGEMGQSADGTCWFSVSSKWHWQFYVPLALYFILALVATIFAAIRTWNFASGATRYAVKIIIRMALYVSVFLLSWLGPTVSEIFISIKESQRRDGTPVGFTPAMEGDPTSEGLKWWTAISVALVGFLNSTIWLSNPVIYKLIKEKLIAKYCTCFSSFGGGERIRLVEKIEQAILEDEDQDITRLNIVFRNSALACLLLGIRYSLVDLSKPRIDKTHYALNNTAGANSARGSLGLSSSSVEHPPPLRNHNYHHSVLNASMEPAPVLKEKHEITSHSSVFPTIPTKHNHHHQSRHSSNIDSSSSSVGEIERFSGLPNVIALEDVSEAAINKVRNSTLSPSVIENIPTPTLGSGWVMTEKPRTSIIAATQHSTSESSNIPKSNLHHHNYHEIQTIGDKTLLGSIHGPAETEVPSEPNSTETSYQFIPDDSIRMLSMADFNYVATRDLTPQHLENLYVPDLFTSPFTFDDVAPQVFHNIRLRFGFKSAAYYKSLAPAPFFDAVFENQQFSGGRSGSFMCFSPDRKFIIKTIPKHEFKTMQKILPAYYEHVHKFQHTLLLPILGLYAIKLTGAPYLHIIVMANLFCNPILVPSSVYDLKGSWVDRTGSKTGGIRKDNDVKTPFSMATSDQRSLWEQLEADSKLLASQGVMDYSLLIGVVKTPTDDSVPPPRKLKRSRNNQNSHNINHNGSSSPSSGYLSSAPISLATSESSSNAGSLSNFDNLSLSSHSPVRSDINHNGFITPDLNGSPARPNQIPATHISPSSAINDSSNTSSLIYHNNHHNDDEMVDIRIKSSRKHKASVGTFGGQLDFVTPGRVIASENPETLYIVGIIDILQSYNMSKKSERAVKVYFRCKDPEGLSSITPDIYQKRFSARMAQNVGFTIHIDEDDLLP